MSRFEKLRERSKHLSDQKLYESIAAATDAAREMNEIDPRSSPPKWDAEMKSRKMEEQDGKCALSGEELTADNLTVDHIVPQSYGGGHEEENLQLATRSANSSKGNSVEIEVLNTYTEGRLSRWEKM